MLMVHTIKFKGVKPDDARIQTSIESKDIVANLFTDGEIRVMDFRTGKSMRIYMVLSSPESRANIDSRELARIVNMHINRGDMRMR